MQDSESVNREPGAHRMWPNFRVYAMDTDGDTDTTDDVVMVQAINYYHPDSGESGTSS